MKRGDLLRYAGDGSLWIVEWANERYIKIATMTHPILIEYSDLEVVSEGR